MKKTIDLLKSIPMCVTVQVADTDIEISRFPTGANGSFIFTHADSDDTTIIPDYDMIILYSIARRYGIKDDSLLVEKPASSGLSTLLFHYFMYERSALADRLKKFDDYYCFKEILWLNTFDEQYPSLGFRSITYSDEEFVFDCITPECNMVTIDENTLTFTHYRSLLEAIELEHNELP